MSLFWQHAMSFLCGSEAQCRNHCDFSGFNECIGVVISNAISLWRATYSLDNNSLGWLGIPIGPLWPAIQLDATQSPYWKLHLVTRDSQLVVALTPSLFDDFIQITFIAIYFGNLLFPYCLSNGPYFQLSLPIFLLLLLPSPSLLVFPFEYPTPNLSIAVYSIFLSQGELSVPLTPSLYIQPVVLWVIAWVSLT